jgi:hypothetical protein
MDAHGGQFDPRPGIFPEPLDVLKRLGLGIARKHPIAIFRHAQPYRVQQRGGGSADRRAMQAALLRGDRRLSPGGGFEIELIPMCAATDGR